MLDISPAKFDNQFMARHQNFSGRLPVSATKPTSPIQGDEYYDSATDKWMRYDGANWRGVTLITTSTSTSSSTSSSTTTS